MLNRHLSLVVELFTPFGNQRSHLLPTEDHHSAIDGELREAPQWLPAYFVHLQKRLTSTTETVQVYQDDFILATLFL